MITHVPNIGATRSDIHIYIYIYILYYILYIYITYIYITYIYIYIRTFITLFKIWILGSTSKIVIFGCVAAQSQKEPARVFSRCSPIHNGLTMASQMIKLRVFFNPSICQTIRDNDLCFHLRLVRPLRAGEEAKWKLRPRL